MNKNIVYKYACTCGEVYVGETKRRLAVRAKEHAQNTSPLKIHAAECQNSFSYHNFSILAKGLRGIESRKRCETLYIKHYDRRAQTVNTQTTSRELIIF